MGSPDAAQAQGGLFSPPASGRRSGLPPRPSPGLKRQPSGQQPAVAKQPVESSSSSVGVVIRIASPVVAERPRPRQHHHAKAAVEAPLVPVAGRVLDFSSPPDKDKDKDKETCVAAAAECPKLPISIAPPQPGVLGFFSPTPKGGPPSVIASPEVILALAESEKTQLQQVLDAKTETADALRQLAEERAARVKAEQAAEQAAASAKCDIHLAMARVQAAERVAAEAKLAVQSAVATSDKLRGELEMSQQQMRSAVEEAAVTRAALTHKEVEAENALFACRELEVSTEETTYMRACARQLRTGLHSLLGLRGVTPREGTSDAMADCMEALKALSTATDAAHVPPAAEAVKKPAAVAHAKPRMAARDVQEILKRPWGRATPAPARTPSATPRQEAPRLRAERSAPCLSYRSAMHEEEDCDDDMPAVTADGAPRSAVKARRALGAFNISALDLRTTPHKARTPGRQGSTPGVISGGQENVCSESSLQQQCVTPGSSLRMLGGAARVEVIPGSRIAMQLAASAVPSTPKPDWTTRW